MKIDNSAFTLPINEILENVSQYLKTNNSLIIHAPPGAGKSTLLPLSLLDKSFLNKKKILMLEPRRLAAKSIAMRMADLIGEKVGETIGYRIRFDSKISDKTKLEVVTEGILTRMLQDDQELTDYSVVIFDEFHERSIHADLGLALCKEAQAVLRPELKIIVMSATLDIPVLSAMLECETISSTGKTYPVDIKYTGDADQYMLPELCSQIILKAVKENEGDALVFLPGQREIIETEKRLKYKLKDFAIMPLFGSMPINKQHAAIFPHKEGKRKIVLATSIAETSLTIEGVKIVIDSGYGRFQKFDPNSGLSRLYTSRISKDAATQRAGRAGRLSKGVCYRMWTETTHHRLSEHALPEIEEADLCNLALELAKWGVDASQLNWVTPPPIGTYSQAISILHDLEALDKNKITQHGKEIAKLPCHPRIGHMLLSSEEDDSLPLAADIAALLEERDPLGKDYGADINTRIDALRTYRRESRKGGRMGRINQLALQYLSLFEEEPITAPVDHFETGLVLTYAYPERIAHAKPGNNAQFKLANGKIAAIGHKDDLAHEAWLAVAHIDARDGLGKIHMASPLNPKDLQRLVKKKEEVTWDTEDGGLSASLNLCIGNIILQSTPLPDPDPDEISEAIVKALKIEGKHLLDWNEKTKNLQTRVACLKKWRPQEKWPDFQTEALLLTIETWLLPYLNQITRPLQLKKLNLYDILLNSLPYELQMKLNNLAPDKIEVPSGSKIKIDYRDDGLSPVLAVKIQEVFGLETSPTINEGKTTILLHLLSPGYKPMQVTDDLNSFWQSTYFEVKKELKARYPKHYWPEDPLIAEPTHKAKPRK